MDEIEKNYHRKRFERMMTLEVEKKDIPNPLAGLGEIMSKIDPKMLRFYDDLRKKNND